MATWQVYIIKINPYQERHPIEKLDMAKKKVEKDQEILERGLNQLVDLLLRQVEEETDISPKAIPDIVNNPILDEVMKK